MYNGPIPLPSFLSPSLTPCVGLSCCAVQMAYVDGLRGSALFDSMLAEDEDAEQIQMLPGVDTLMEEYPPPPTCPLQ